VDGMMMILIHRLKKSKRTSKKKLKNILRKNKTRILLPEEWESHRCFLEIEEILNILWMRMRKKRCLEDILGLSRHLRELLVKRHLIIKKE
jgi:hypothetical protein